LDVRDYFYIASLIASIAAALFGIWKARRDSEDVVSRAATAAAVEKALHEERLKTLERRQGELQAEVHGVRAGFESGIARVHDSLGEIAKGLQDLRTEVAVINAIAERPTRGGTRSTRKATA